MTLEAAEQAAKSQRTELESHGAFNNKTEIRFDEERGYLVYLTYDVNADAPYFPPVTGEACG